MPLMAIMAIMIWFSVMLADGGRVLSIGAGIEIAVAVGLHGGDQRDVRRQVHEVAGEQFEIGMDGAKLDFAGGQRTRDRGALRGRPE
jgi:hypothetical protein